MLKVHKFSNIEDLEGFLQGSVLGGKALPLLGGKVFGLHGLTLIINTTTVTFSDASGAGLTLADIKTAITGVAGVTMSWSDGRLRLKHGSGITVDKDGTANPLFGFDSATDTAGIVYAPPDGDAPRFIQADAAPSGDSIYVVVEEA